MDYPQFCFQHMAIVIPFTWGVGVQAKAHVWRAEDSFGNHFSPSTMWAPRLEFRSLDLPSSEVDGVILTCHPQIFKPEV